MVGHITDHAWLFWHGISRSQGDYLRWRIFSPLSHTAVGHGAMLEHSRIFVAMQRRKLRKCRNVSMRPNSVFTQTNCPGVWALDVE
jgi:hypothetical protein